MGKLTNLKSQVSSLRSRLPQARDAEGHSRTAETGRAWYSLARWRRLRWSVLTRDLFTCTRCGRLEGDTSKLVADHIRPHCGDPVLFWDDANLTTLCASCHSGAKQRSERRAR